MDIQGMEVIKHEDMHTNSSQAWRWHDQPVSQFMQRPWHRARKNNGEMNARHWTAEEKQEGAHSVIYCIFEKTDSRKKKS